MRSSDGSSQDASRFGGSRSLMYGVSNVVKTSKRRISRAEKMDVDASLVLIENEGVTFFFYFFVNNKISSITNYRQKSRLFFQETGIRNLSAINYRL